jgi:uncharacterized protein YndB with AHSA1/START domain
MTAMDQVEREVEVPKPAADVWAAVADAERLGAWMGGDFDLEIRPGARGGFRSPDGTARRVLVLAVDEGHELCYRWWSESDAREASTVTITIDERDEGESTVRVRETRAQALLATA